MFGSKNKATKVAAAQERHNNNLRQADANRQEIQAYRTRQYTDAMTGVSPDRAAGSFFYRALGADQAYLDERVRLSGQELAVAKRRWRI